MEDPLKPIVENKVNKILSDILKTDSVQDMFYNIHDVQFSEKNIEGKVAKLCTDLRAIFTESSDSQANNLQKLETKDSLQRVQEIGLHALVNSLSVRSNPAQAQVIASILYYLATSKAVSAKAVCTTLLAHEKLHPDNNIFWLSTFRLIKLIIPGVDYKGVRELMKSCLELARLLPVSLKHSQLQQADAICDLLHLIFDRNAALLPAYFIVNELLKFFPDLKTWPHWRLSRMLSGFIDTCRKATQMLSIVGRHRLRPVVEYSGNNSPSINSWKLDSTTLKFPLKGALPYSSILTSSQDDLLKHVFKQTYSKEFIITMLDIQKRQRYPVLERHLVELYMESLEECAAADAAAITNSPNTTINNTENSDSMGSSQDMASTTDSYVVCGCTHITYMLVNFVLNGWMTFNAVIQLLREKLKEKPQLFHAGRDHLIWSLFQLLSYSIDKWPMADLQPLLRLIESLYPEKKPLPVPDCFDSRCALRLSAMCMLIHILRKAQRETGKIPQSLPPAFTGHHELLQNLVHNPQAPLLSSAGFPNYHSPGYRLGLLLNAYSSNQEVFRGPLSALVEGIQGNPKSTVPMPGINCVALGSTTPFKMSFLDSLTLYVKMVMLQHIVSNINKHSQQKSNVALAPALIETYARLLVSQESDNFSLKSYISTLLTNAFKNQAYGNLHALLEMLTYRIHHTLPQYRIQLVSTIHHMMSFPINSLGNMHQLHLCMESSALRLITGFGNTEVMPNLPRFFGTDTTKTNIISTESEELNRVIVLTMARAIHITGCDSSSESSRWCFNFLKAVMNHTPHTWATHTLQCFPTVMQEFYKQHGSPRDTQQLKQTAVEEEYRKWKSMSNENDIIAHFSHQHNTSNLFLCLLFKMVFDTTRVPAEAYKVLERLSPRQLMAHVRTLCDFLVIEFSNSSVGQHLTKCVETINSIVWQYNVVPIDRLILCLALRTQEGLKDAQVSLFIMQLILLRPAEFRNRVQEFVNENSPEHWKQTKWYEKHMAFHRRFPEKFAPETLISGQSSLSPQHQTLPIYFANVCVRFLPVLDIVIHRYIEIHQIPSRLENVLEHLGGLYKFHDRPITYLYNTLHYYEERLRDSPIVKKQLVGAVVMSQRNIKPSNWALTEDYISYLGQSNNEIWNPSASYYSTIVKRLVFTLQGKSPFPPIEWRFNEFANASAHAIHVTCVELMALPNTPSVVANNLLNIVLKGYCEIASDDLMDWINAIGLILSWLPEAYWTVVHEKIINLLQMPEFSSPGPDTVDPYVLLNFDLLTPVLCDCTPAFILSIVHSFWHHASFGQLEKVLLLMREDIQPILKTEEQLIVLCHLVTPFLQRFNCEDNARKIYDITVELYQALATVDRCVSEMRHQDAICDLLYHIKYQFIGDSVKNSVESIIRGLRPSLQLRLRFITHLNIEAIEGKSGPSTVASACSTAPSVTSTTTSMGSGNAVGEASPVVSTGVSLPPIETNPNNNPPVPGGPTVVSSNAGPIPTGPIIQ